MKHVDTIIHARWLIPVEPQSKVFEHHAVIIEQGRIAAITNSASARRDYRADDIVELDDHVLIPGLINAHSHLAMNLFRGIADDLPLMNWLNEHIWPAEQRWVDDTFAFDGSMLAIAEMLRGGITCFNDMYFFPDQTARAAAQTGIRCNVGLIVLDFPTVWAHNADEYLDKGIRIHDALKGEPLVNTCFAPHAPYTVTDDVVLTRLGTLADELDIPIHMHIHETADEVEQAMATHKQRPLQRLYQLGLLSPRLQAVHMTQLTQQEIVMCAEHGVNVIHCPESNLKLASGFCPVAQLLEAGVNVALGTDGAASNNDLDMFGEMRSAALLAKGVAKDARALPAAQALYCATMGGAKALALEGRIGSLSVGKDADITAIDLGALETQPVYDPLSHLVYCCGRHQVSDVWVRGKRLLQQRRLTTLDSDVVVQKAQQWRNNVAATNSGLIHN